MTNDRELTYIYLTIFLNVLEDFNLVHLTHVNVFFHIQTDCVLSIQLLFLINKSFIAIFSVNWRRTASSHYCVVFHVYHNIYFKNSTLFR